METSQRAMDTTENHQRPEGYAMYDYEMHQMRAAELAQEAAHRRLVREARRTRAAARRSARDEAEGRVIAELGRTRFTRAA
ncbi:hypothetical protein [Streptomyces formicae]|uniref:Uncharacterized protein n=1 Tax=Streptomyces formicae TaxID=1616117 RepID=A0A291QGF2_9ACTN|nr:hypothetical protein [Streptomyces formicae]ATL30682.1 hypothetical protein KY5_5664 [Streptomyces formicae]